MICENHYKEIEFRFNCLDKARNSPEPSIKQVLGEWCADKGVKPVELKTNRSSRAVELRIEFVKYAYYGFHFNDREISEALNMSRVSVTNYRNSK